MIIFITTIKHPDNSHNYHKIAYLLERTLKSVCTQTDKNFRVLVVCNSKPDITFDADLVEFIVLDNFASPSIDVAKKMSIDNIRLDKGTKYLMGCQYAARFKPDYIMFFDADDFISRDIVGYLNQHKGENGFIIDQGYIYRDGGLLIRELPHFNTRCGTSVIFNPKLFKLPKNIDSTMSKSQLLAQIDKKYVCEILGAHKFSADYFKQQGCAFKILPKQLAIWVLETGENTLGERFFNSNVLRFYKFASPSVQRDFSFKTPPFNLRLFIKECSNLCLYNFKILCKLIYHFSINKKAKNAV